MFWDRISLCSSAGPRYPLTNGTPPISASKVLGLIIGTSYHAWRTLNKCLVSPCLVVKLLLKWGVWSVAVSLGIMRLLQTQPHSPATLFTLLSSPKAHYPQYSCSYAGEGPKKPESQDFQLTCLFLKLFLDFPIWWYLFSTSCKRVASICHLSLPFSQYINSGCWYQAVM